MPALSTDPSTFRFARVASLQPAMVPEDLLAEPTQVADSNALNDMLHLLRVWSQGRADVTPEFWQQVQIVGMTRQPLASVSLAAQVVTRTLKPVEEPLKGSSINKQRWSSQDLFELKPIVAPVFPAQPDLSSVPLTGQEEALDCDACRASGKVTCPKCLGSPISVCPDCTGRGVVVCKMCEGAGKVIQRGQQVVVCPTCKGECAIACARCRKTGKVKCLECAGVGACECRKCSGGGRIRRRWLLATEISTRNDYFDRLSANWPFDSREIADEMDVLAEDQWTWPQASAALPLDTLLPSEFRANAASMIDEQLAAVEGDSQSRCAALRLRLMGTFLYQVQFQVEGRTGVVLVGGAGGHVKPVDMPDARRGILQTLLGWMDRAFAAVRLGNYGLDKEYVSGVRGRAVHVSDQRSLGTALRSRGFGVKVSQRGYLVTAPQRRDRPEVTFAVDLLAGTTGKLCVASSVAIGPAVRDVFPRALAKNHRLLFGYLAVTEDPTTREEMFTLVDRRGYETLLPEQLAQILTAMADQVPALAKALS